MYDFISMYPGFQYRPYFTSFLYCTVNVAHNITQCLQGTASMSGEPFPRTRWTAQKVVDGNANRSAIGGSCAIMDVSKHYRSVWLKVEFEFRFNVAYIQLFFRNEGSMLLYK